MRRKLLRTLMAVLTLTVIPAAHAQSFSAFILSGKAGDLATGDISFRTPDLAARKIDVGVSFGKWVPQQLNYAALQAGGFFALDERLGIRLDYRHNLFPAFPAVDVNGNEKGTFKPSEQRILAGVSFRLSENMFIDVNGKYLAADMAGNKAAAFAGDVAFNYLKDGLTLGVKGADIGSKYHFDSTPYSLPMRVMAGGSCRLNLAQQHGLLLGADLGYILPQEYKAFTAAVGAEYTFDQMIFVRAGYHYASAVAPRFASFGLGFAFKGIGLDAAYLLGPVANAWTVTLKVIL